MLMIIEIGFTASRVEDKLNNYYDKKCIKIFRLRRRLKMQKRDE